jgi:hypothetical protein
MNLFCYLTNFCSSLRGSHQYQVLAVSIQLKSDWNICHGAYSCHSEKTALEKFMDRAYAGITGVLFIMSKDVSATPTFVVIGIMIDFFQSAFGWLFKASLIGWFLMQSYHKNLISDNDAMPWNSACISLSRIDHLEVEPCCHRMAESICTPWLTLYATTVIAAFKF